MPSDQEYTLEQFHEQYKFLTGSERPSMAHLRRCCRGDKDPRTGKRAKLPEGWEAFKKRGDKRWYVRRATASSKQDTRKKEEFVKTILLIQQLVEKQEALLQTLPLPTADEIEPIFVRPSVRRLKRTTLVRQAQFALTKLQVSILEEPELASIAGNSLKKQLAKRDQAFQAMMIHLPEPILQDISAARHAAKRTGSKFVVKLIFHEDGSVDGEMLEPIGHLMFMDPVAQIFFLVWFSMRSDPKLRDVRTATTAWRKSVLDSLTNELPTGNTFLRLLIAKMSDSVFNSIPDFEKRCIGCTRYREPRTSSLYCTKSCRDELSDYLKKIDLSSGRDDDELCNSLISRLKRFGLHAKALK